MNRRQAITRTNADRFRWRIYAALGGDELMRPSHMRYTVFGAIGEISTSGKTADGDWAKVMVDH